VLSSHAPHSKGKPFQVMGILLWRFPLLVGGTWSWSCPSLPAKPTPNHGQFFVAVSVPSGWRMVWFMPTPPGASPPLVKGNSFWRFPFLVGGAWSWSCPSQCKPRVYKLGAYTLGAYRLEPPVRGLEMHSVR
jgi:hypothetical protein